MTKVYRIRHVPTGMYFCPSREVKVKLQDGQPWQQSGVYVKSNLSKTGKTYLRKPSLAYVGTNYYTHLITSVRELNDRVGSCCMKPVVESEWQIDQVQVTLGQT